MHVAIVLYDGADELDVVGPYRVFQGAAAEGAAVTTSLRTLEPTDTVTLDKGLGVECDGLLEDADPDLVVVPGGGWNNRESTGAWAEAERGPLPSRLADLHDAEVTLAAVCTGGMLLERAGVLDGRPAVTHAGAMDDLRASAADVVEARVVDDGDIVTAGGVTSGIDMALHLVERAFGAAVADAVATELEHERRGPVVES